MRRIIYICNTRFPTEKAHGLATAKICEAFADLGIELDLVVPRFWGKRRDPFSFYKIKNNFKIRFVPCLDLPYLIPWTSLEKITFLIQSISYTIISFLYVLLTYRKTLDEEVFISHDYLPLWAMTFSSNNVFYDVHHFPGKNFAYKRLMQKSFGFAVQTKWKISELSKKWNIDPSKIIYWPNGTDVEMFDIPLDTILAREKLSLPKDSQMVLYMGQLIAWKGVDTLVRSLNYIDAKAEVYIVGGSSADVLNLKSDIPEATNSRLHFVEFQRREIVPVWLKAADVLVLPNTGKQKVSMYYTSPLKLFEYMASGRPIVASDIPSIAEILNKHNALLVPPDEPKLLAESVNHILKDPSLADQLSNKAKQDIQKYTWKARAEKISNHIDQIRGLC